MGVSAVSGCRQRFAFLHTSEVVTCGAAVYGKCICNLLKGVTGIFAEVGEYLFRSFVFQLFVFAAVEDEKGKAK